MNFQQPSLEDALRVLARHIVTEMRPALVEMLGEVLQVGSHDPTEGQPEWMTTAQVCEFLQADRKSLYNWIRDGHLSPPAKMGKKNLFARDAVSEALRSEGGKVARHWKQLNKSI